MAFSTHVPTAPWTTGISGSGTWGELVTFINDTNIIEKVGDTFIIRGLIEIKAVMSPLLNSMLINRSGGSWSLASGGSATFGRLVTNASGVSIPVDGCDILDDVDAYARGSDNYNNSKCWVRSGATLTLYASTYKNKIAGSSHLDFAAGAWLIVRTGRFTVDSTNDSFDHYQANLDIDGLVSTHASDILGSILELYNGTITKLANFTPFLNSSTTRQCTLWSNKVILEKWGGDNFSPYNITGYQQLVDPKSTQLKKVDATGSPGSNISELRTVEVLALQGSTGVSAEITCINNVGQVDTKGTANAQGVYTGTVKRRSFPGGSSYNPYGVERTPHILYARKWGYITVTSTLNATPTSYAQERISAVVPMDPDENITLSSGAAAAIANVTLTFHGRPVTWQAKPYSVTITAPADTALSDVYHSVAYQASELTTKDSRTAISFTDGGHLFYKQWTGSRGDTDLTLVMVGTHRLDNSPAGSQFLGSVGTSTNSIACRAHNNNGLVIQNYTTDLFDHTLTNSSQNASRTTDGGRQLVIAIGRYNATAHTMELWCNGMYVGSQACTINRGTDTQYVRIGGIANVGAWAAGGHIACEMLAYDRAITNQEVSDINQYLANKWHMTGTGNLAPGTSVVLNPVNYPVNSSGLDWNPMDADVANRPLFWVSTADDADYTLNGSNMLIALRDKATNTFFSNSQTTSATQVIKNFRQRITPQLLLDPTSTCRQLYHDGFYRGVRVIDQAGNPFPGFTSMQADDGTYYIPPTITTLTVTGIKLGSEVRLYRSSDMLELIGVETFSATNFLYSYEYQQDIPAILVVFSLGYNPIYLELVLTDSNATIPIQQTIDRNYIN